MTTKKNNKAVWNTRIKKKTSSLFQKIGSSLVIDKQLYKEDIVGSKVHVEMLFKQKIISFKIKNKIIYGLDKIEKEIKNNKFKDWNNYKKLKEINASIGYSYGFTVHKSQGSSFDYVFVDLQDILKCKEDVLRNKILYVACSRAKKKLYLIYD